MSRRATDSVCRDLNSSRPSAPDLVVGGRMPCHAFTDKVLLLARGERIVSSSQLERLSRPDVMFSNDPPEWLVPAIQERQKALGVFPFSFAQGTDSERERPDSATEPRPGSAERAQPATPFVEELRTARRLRRAAIHQVAELVEHVRAGERIDLEPVRGMVRQVVDSLRRNERALASLVRLKHRHTYTYTHSINNCVLSAILAQHGGLRAEEADMIGLGALMHDLGKVRLPETVLNKAEGLAPSEWAMVKHHPVTGIEILRACNETMEPTVLAVAQHHERLDGSGYPRGLRDDAVAPAGRIVAIADVYDAMTSDRPYRRAIHAPDAVRWIFQHGGDLFDPQLVRRFIGAIGLFPIGSVVRLNTGELGVVASVNPQAIRRPTVIIICDAAGHRLANPRPLDLGQLSALSDSTEIIGFADAADLAVDVEEYLDMAFAPSDPELGDPDRLA